MALDINPIILTIAIPTYNRPYNIKNTVSLLLPQLSFGVKVLVLDNCSPVNVKDILLNEFGAGVFEKVEVIRHRLNIGGDANIERCFELCETEYIWVLGDDDKVEPDAVKLIYNEIEKYKNEDLIGINFRTNCMNIARNSPVFIKNTEQLSEKLDHFGNWLFISSSIYKTREYCKHLHYAMYGAYSMCSQIFPALMAIGENKTFILSEKYLVSNIPQSVDVKWSNYQLALGLSAILEARIGFKKREYLAFGRKFYTLLETVYPGDTFYSILKSVQSDIRLIDAYHVYIYKQLFLKTFEFRRKKLTHLFQYRICMFLLRNKSFLRLLILGHPSFKEKVIKAVPFYLFQR